jgi:hypothetical protein
MRSAASRVNVLSRSNAPAHASDADEVALWLDLTHVRGHLAALAVRGDERGEVGEHRSGSGASFARAGREKSLFPSRLALLSPSGARVCY